jgi:DNA-binding transcriptional regulator YiaG
MNTNQAPSTQDLQQIHNKLNEIQQTLKTLESSALFQKEFLDNQEFIQLMNISKRTAQYWRDQGIIPYSQIGAKIYYNLDDVKAILLKHKTS